MSAGIVIVAAPPARNPVLSNDPAERVTVPVGVLPAVEETTTLSVSGALAEMLVCEGVILSVGVVKLTVMDAELVAEA